MGFPDGSAVKNLSASAGDMGSIPGSGRSSGEGNGSPPQHSCLGNPMDRGTWWASVHRVAKSKTRLSEQQQQLDEMQRSIQMAKRHGARCGEVVYSASSSFMSSATWKFSDPHTIGLFMEASSHKCDGSLSQFLPPLFPSWRIRNGAETPKLLTIVWSFWWPAPIQDPIKHCLIRTKYIPLTHQGNFKEFRSSVLGPVVKDQILEQKILLYPYVCSSTICNSQDMETTEMCIDRWVDKDDVVYIYNGSLLSHKRMN